MTLRNRCVFRIFGLVLLCVSLLGSAPSRADELRIHVIRPRLAIDWTSPRSLSLTSAIDSAGNDYAPIGHFAVEARCSRANAFGVRNILTGMERRDRRESRRIVLREGLGLGSLTYAFEGRLQPASESASEIEAARRDRRLSTLVIPTSSDRCGAILDFVEQWIDAGSYTVYAGGRETAFGEGAGCADFAERLFEIAEPAAGRLGGEGPGTAFPDEER